MGDPTKGLLPKFLVRRMDGSHGHLRKHDGCHYFVLDLTRGHDKFALPALRAYVEACRAEYPLLADDLERACNEMEPGSTP